MSITTQTETILTTLPLPTVASVPPENFRFVPGSAMVTNSTINPRITNGTHKSPFFNGTGYYIEEETEQGKIEHLFLRFSNYPSLVLNKKTEIGKLSEKRTILIHPVLVLFPCLKFYKPTLVCI